MIDTIIGSIISSAAIAGIVVWLSKAVISERLKKAIQYEYDQKLETYKNELKYQSDLNLEELRSELTIIEKEREILFFKLQEKRAEVIEDIHEKLVIFFQNLRAYVKQFGNIDEKIEKKYREEAEKSFFNFRKIFLIKAIYLPTSLHKQIESFMEESYVQIKRFEFEVEPRETSDYYNVWNEIYKKVDTDLSSIKEELENQFRKLLGNCNHPHLPSANTKATSV